MVRILPISKIKIPTTNVVGIFMAVLNLMHIINGFFRKSKRENLRAATFFSIPVQQHRINFAFELNRYYLFCFKISSLDSIVLYHRNNHSGDRIRGHPFWMHRIPTGCQLRQFCRPNARLVEAMLFQYPAVCVR